MHVLPPQTYDKSAVAVYSRLAYFVGPHNTALVLALLQNEPLFLRTYTDAEGEEEEDANLRLHNIVHSSLDVVGERKGMIRALLFQACRLLSPPVGFSSGSSSRTL